MRVFVTTTERTNSIGHCSARWIKQNTRKKKETRFYSTLVFYVYDYRADESFFFSFLFFTVHLSRAFENHVDR